MKRLLKRFLNREPVSDVCPSCDGSGYADYAAVPCELCGSWSEPPPRYRHLTPDAPLTEYAKFFVMEVKHAPYVPERSFIAVEVGRVPRRDIRVGITCFDIQEGDTITVKLVNGLYTDIVARERREPETGVTVYDEWLTAAQMHRIWEGLLPYKKDDPRFVVLSGSLSGKSIP
jgi:hypothetical protein